MDEQSNSLKFGYAQENDIHKIFCLFEKAKKNMEKLNIHQWTPSYPNIDVLTEDINESNLMKLTYDDIIVTVATLNQLSNEDYMISRVVTNEFFSHMGYADQMISLLVEEVIQRDGVNILSFTNHTNFPMQNLFSKNDFKKIDEVIQSDRKSFGLFYKYKKELR